MGLRSSAAGRVGLVVTWLVLFVGATRLAKAEPSAMHAPLGGRSLLMGGTGVALGQDGSVPFLNPAAMSRIADTRLAFSVKLYRWTRAHYTNLVAAPEGWSEGLPSLKTSRNRFQGLPSTFCAFLTLQGLVPESRERFWRAVHGEAGRMKLGLCGANIERSSIDVPAVGGAHTVGRRVTALEMSMSSAWQRFAIGPSLSYQLSSAWSFGASFHGVWTNAVNDWGVNATRVEAGSQELTTLSRASRGRSIDGQTTVGLLYTWRRQSWGVSVRFPAVHFEGQATANRTDHNPDTTASVVLASGSFVAKPAPMLRLGTGQDGETSRMEFDMAYSFGSDAALKADLMQTVYGPDGPRRSRLRQRLRSGDTVSFSAGGEFLLSSKLSLLGGLEFAPALLVDLPKRDPLIVGTRTSGIAWSMGIGSYGPGSELLVGTRIGYEWGQLAAPRFLGSSLAVAERRAWETLLILSGSVSLSAFKRTVDGISELAQASSD